MQQLLWQQQGGGGGLSHTALPGATCAWQLGGLVLAGNACLQPPLSLMQGCVSGLCVWDGVWCLCLCVVSAGCFNSHRCYKGASDASDLGCLGSSVCGVCRVTCGVWYCWDPGAACVQ
jgi:hypothetical protein